MTASFEDSLRDGPHAVLARMAGDWQGTARTWFEPGKLASEAPIKGSMRVVLGGRFVVHEYEGGMEGADMRGISLHGYNLAAKRWETAAIDSAHHGTSVMLQIGADTPQPSALGHYPAPPGPDWGWRTTLELKSDTELVITHYNIAPSEGPYSEMGEYVGVQIEYRRV